MVLMGREKKKRKRKHYNNSEKNVTGASIYVFMTLLSRAPHKLEASLVCRGEL